MMAGKTSKKAPLLGFVAGAGILALAWGVKSLNPIVRVIMVLTGAVVLLSHSSTVIPQIRNAFKQL